MLNKLVFIVFFFYSSMVFAQLLQDERSYTRADTLRGALRPERTNFDVLKYTLDIKISPKEKFIAGSNTITFHTIENMAVMQLDLFSNMKVDSIVYQGRHLKYKREFNAVFISFKNALDANVIDSLQFYYSGNPIVAKNPPWDGGFVFSKDKNGKDFIGVAVQGTGASLWFPNKDHQSDKPEEAEIHLEVPNGLVGVSNGRLMGLKELSNGFTKWSWKVSQPINNYNITLNIGDYVRFSDTFQDLDLDFYVLSYHLEKAKKQFTEVQPMMRCFYEHFGAYPFEEDSYKLVEAPFLGMEHQSAIAYGNNYQLGYDGTDVSLSGIGLKFDFIIIHETAHEWFGNSISADDIADMWIHEAFTSYAEAVYIECRWGKEDALKYLKGLRSTMISNKEPIIGDYGVNKEGSVDMYYKGANLLNTVRSIINDDEKWWSLLKSFSETFKHKITNTEEVIAFFENGTDVSLTPVFEEYLYYAALPTLQMKKEKGNIYYRWASSVTDFEMPIDLIVKEKTQRIYPNQNWQKLKKVRSLKKVKVDVDRFYVHMENL
ncbi:M1 family metallopeptidase [Brumimicrobium sp.]|uniref:M1 family metallopeptidase n=1 Tax=Brumimicrobium sp. TaxID=2029867 RepID=UPI003A90A86D